MVYELDKLPKYTRKEEILNSSSHFVGALFAIGILIYFIVFNAINNLPFSKMIPFYIYGFIMLFMFFMSGFYHSRPFNSKARAITRYIDHGDINLFIAATYTPLCVYAITNKPVGLGLLIAIWVGAIIGIIINNLGINKLPVKIIQFVLYVFLGWLIAFVYPFNIGITFNVFIYILIGGITITIGSALYWVGKKKKYMHSVFHFFILAGTVIQFIGIYYTLISFQAYSLF